MPEHSCPHLPLQCQRLRLRDFRRSDLEQFTEYRANPDIARYQGWDKFCMEDALEYYEILRRLRFGNTSVWKQHAWCLDTQASMLRNSTLSKTTAKRLKLCGKLVNINTSGCG